MGKVDFEKISDHTAVIKDKPAVIWRIRVTGTIDEYYILADKVHAKLGGGYWADTKYLIARDKIRVSEAFENKVSPQTPSAYQQVICGQCNHVNNLNLDTLQYDQGSHYCKRCQATIALVIGKRINLKNGSTAGNVVTR